jgi:endonuclease/exonuclease/phosphatase family metal-dependent hydrolase
MDATVPTTGATLKALLFLLAAVFIPTAVADQPLRVVTWNIETVGEFDSAQHAAALQVLARIDADVVAINEVSGTADGENLADLAFALDYPFTAIAPPGPFGSLRSAFLSAYPLLLSESWTAAELSLDASANDISREILEIVVDLPEDTADPRLLVTHLKSGSSNIDELRRAIDSYRLRQAAESNLTGSGPVIILGDLNRDIGDGAEHPERFTALPDPADLPRAFKIGSDIQSLLHPAEGLRNAPLSFLETEAVTLNALQLDGSDTTRPESGRRIDYILADRFIAGRGALAQVYDCADEGLPGGLPLAGDSLAAKTCADAADHLPVFADLFVPTANASLVSYGDCVMNWAERVYAPLLRPVGTETQFKAPYHYRQYSETGAVVRISEIDNHVDYVNASGTPLDLGPLADWLTLANCEPLPTECLFDWGERFVEDNQFPPGTGLADVAFDLAYRYYPRTGNYLGVSASDEHVLGWIDRRWIDAGSYEIWMRRSRCR